MRTSSTIKGLIEISLFLELKGSKSGSLLLGFKGTNSGPLLRKSNPSFS
jgi:hypothetical protein